MVETKAAQDCGGERHAFYYSYYTFRCRVSRFTREELRRGLGTLEGEAPTNPEICKLSAPGIEAQICCQALGPRTARKAESRWVDPETKGAEVRSAGSRAARSSGGGRGMGSAGAGVDGGLMDLEPELATVEVPAGRVLRCGAALPGRVTGDHGVVAGKSTGVRAAPIA